MGYLHKRSTQFSTGLFIDPRFLVFPMGRVRLGRVVSLPMLDSSRAWNADLSRHRSHRPNRSPQATHYIYDLETAVRVRCGKLSAKGLSYGSDDHAHILRP